LFERNCSFEHLNFPDHHHFTQKDIDRIDSVYNSIDSKKKIILTTEKDYVRLSDEIKGLYYVEIETSFVNRKSKFDNLICSYINSEL